MHSLPSREVGRKDAWRPSMYEQVGGVQDVALQRRPSQEGGGTLQDNGGLQLKSAAPVEKVHQRTLHTGGAGGQPRARSALKQACCCSPLHAPPAAHPHRRLERPCERRRSCRRHWVAVLLWAARGRCQLSLRCTPACALSVRQSHTCRRCLLVRTPRRDGVAHLDSPQPCRHLGSARSYLLTRLLFPGVDFPL